MGAAALSSCGMHSKNKADKTQTVESTPSVFWDVVPSKASYLYVPGLTSSGITMGRYCPEFVASTGEKISWTSGGHVIGQPNTTVAFPDACLKKPTRFTLNPITAFLNGIRRDLYPIMERCFNEKYGVTVVDNESSKYTVVNYTPNFSAANVGQTIDIKCLHKHYKNHIKKYPQADVILYGDSRGAATIFNFITLHKPERVKAAVVEGLFDSVTHGMKHFLYDDKPLATEERLHQMFSMVMRKYRKDGINPGKCAQTITDDIPLLIVSSLKDGLVAPQSTFNVYKQLKKRGHKNVHLLVLKKSLHPAYMVDDPQDQIVYESVVHAFYKQYNLPHNSKKASLGYANFLKTQPTPEELAALYPLATCEQCV